MGKMYYKAESDPKFIFANDEPLTQKPVKIFLDDDASVEEKQFAYQLEDIMQKRGFNVVLDDEESALCVLDFSLRTPSYQSSGHYTTYSTNTSIVSVPSSYSVNGFTPMRNFTTTSTTPQIHSYNEINTYKKIYIRYTCLDKNHKASRFGDGFFSTEIAIYSEYQSYIVHFIVDSIGQNKEGYYYPYDDIYIYIYMQRRESENATRTKSTRARYQ